MARDHALYAFVLSFLVLLGIIVLAALGDEIPPVLTALAGGAFGAGAGLAVPAHSRSPK